MASAYKEYFEDNIERISGALKSIDKKKFEELIDECESTLRGGHRIIASGLGKNVPICEKFVGTMISMGMDAFFLNTNSAVHGDMGAVKPGDLLIILSKSGATEESIYLHNLIKDRGNIRQWLLTFEKESKLADDMSDAIIIDLEHEGDMWDIVPSNSTTVNLIILQELAIELSRRFDLKLYEDFKPNHPGGAIGERLRNEK